MVNRIINSKSKTFLAFCFCFLAGIAAGSVYNKRVEFVYVYLLFFIAAALLIVFWKNKVFRFTLGGLLITTLAFTRYALALPAPLALPDSRQTFTSYVSAEPDVRPDGVRYIVKARDNEFGRQGKKRVYVKSGLYPRYEYGDELRIECQLKSPEPIEDFRYDMYLATFRVFTLCLDAQIEKVGEGAGNPVYQIIFALKRKIAERINQLWHEPYAGFISGLLYGYRGGLGRLNEQFNRTGVTHIIAVSGYNISIIATILITLCVHLWIPRQKAFWLINTGIVLFVVFVGLSGSVVRAGIMGGLALLAKQLGRVNRVGNAMAFTAVLMTWHNPFVLVWDAGFQLSFLATIGLVYLSPILGRPFGKVPEWLGLKESLVATLAAILSTLPLILYQFGRLSLVAPLVNVLILWIIPWLMLFGFASVWASWLFYPLGQVSAWLTWAGMRYVTALVEWFAGLRFAAVDFHLPLAVVLLLYLGLVSALIYYYQAQGKERRKLLAVD